MGGSWKPASQLFEVQVEPTLFSLRQTESTPTTIRLSLYYPFFQNAYNSRLFPDCSRPLVLGAQAACEVHRPNNQSRLLRAEIGGEGRSEEAVEASHRQ